MSHTFAKGHTQLMSLGNPGLDAKWSAGGSQPQILPTKTTQVPPSPPQLNKVTLKNSST